MSGSGKRLYALAKLYNNLAPRLILHGLEDGVASVGDEVGSGAEGGHLGGEEEEAARDLARLGEPAHRRARGPFGPKLAPGLGFGRHFRLDVAWTEDVDPNALRGPVASERLTEVR